MSEMTADLNMISNPSRTRSVNETYRLMKWMADWEFIFRKRYDFICHQDSAIKSISHDDSTSRDSRIIFSQFGNMKMSLYNVKSQLTPLDVNKWGEHTSYSDPSGWILRRVKSTLGTRGEEACNIFLTRGWLKMTEILHEFGFKQLINSITTTSHPSEFRALFLCEAPGGFVSAVEYFMLKYFPTTELKWTATSLNPNQIPANRSRDAITDKRFMNRDEATASRWYFGPDGSGDILRDDFISGLSSHVKNIQFDLITADGGLDCSEKPALQEESVYSLIEAEIQCALIHLKIGGHFILKLFTFFQMKTASLLTLLTTCFKSVSLFKPSTSKEGNSEHYLICLHYCLVQRSEHEFSTLLQSCSNFTDSNSQTFSEILQACSFFTDCQQNAINKNLALFKLLEDTELNEMERTRLHSHICRIKSRVSATYVRKFCI